MLIRLILCRANLSKILSWLLARAALIAILKRTVRITVRDSSFSLNLLGLLRHTLSLPLIAILNLVSDDVMVIDMIVTVSVCVMMLYDDLLLVLMDGYILLGVMLNTSLFKSVIVLIVIT